MADVTGHKNKGSDDKRPVHIEMTEAVAQELLDYFEARQEVMKLLRINALTHIDPKLEEFIRVVGDVVNQ